MASKKKFWRTSNLRLLLILELAVMLPALALIAVNFYHLRSIERDKAIEAAARLLHVHPHVRRAHDAAGPDLRSHLCPGQVVDDE